MRANGNPKKDVARCLHTSFMMCDHRKMCRIRLFKEFEGEKCFSILIDRKIVMFVALLDSC